MSKCIEGEAKARILVLLLDNNSLEELFIPTIGFSVSLLGLRRIGITLESLLSILISLPRLVLTLTVFAKSRKCSTKFFETDELIEASRYDGDAVDLGSILEAIET